MVTGVVFDDSEETDGNDRNVIKAKATAKRNAAEERRDFYLS